MGDDDGVALDRVRAIPAQAPTGEHRSSLQAKKKRLETRSDHSKAIQGKSGRPAKVGLIAAQEWFFRACRPAARTEGLAVLNSSNGGTFADAGRISPQRRCLV